MSQTFCQYGTEIKPEVTTNTFYIAAADALAAISSLMPGLTPYLNAIIGQIAPRYVDLTAMCGRVPPAPPSVDLQTLFVSGQWAAIPQWTVDWFWSLWENNTWNTYCQCSAGGTPACRFIADTSVAFTGAAAREIARWDPIPVGAATLHYEMSFPFLAGGWSATIRYIRTDGTMGSGIGVGNDNTPPFFAGTTLNTNASGFVPRGVAFFLGTLGANQSENLLVHTMAEIPGCEATPPPPLVFDPPDPPPPPDTPPPGEPPTGCTNDQICAFLESIVATLQTLTDTLGNVQASQSQHIIMDSDTNDRTHAYLPVDMPDCPDCILVAGPGTGGGALPPGYVVGDTHGPFTGSGAISVHQLVGMQIGVSAHPPNGLELEGQPPYLWNMGWASILNDDGMLDEKRITREGYVWLPPYMPLATSFTWTLRDEVEIYVQELLPVPVLPP
jgi:hypothetical protein